LSNLALNSQEKKKRAITARLKKLIMTELVSRVLYAFGRSNHLSSLIITDKFKPCGSATMKRREQLVGTNPENQGVASDRVYSGSMLP
jgi:hypothetical protein